MEKKKKKKEAILLYLTHRSSFSCEKNHSGISTKQIREFLLAYKTTRVVRGSGKAVFILSVSDSSVSGAGVCFHRSNRRLFYCRIIKGETFGCQAGIHSRHKLHAAGRYLSFPAPAFPRSKDLVISSRTPRACLLARRQILTGQTPAAPALKARAAEKSSARQNAANGGMRVGRTHQDDDSSRSNEGVEEATL